MHVYMYTCIAIINAFTCGHMKTAWWTIVYCAMGHGYLINSQLFLMVNHRARAKTVKKLRDRY